MREMQRSRVFPKLTTCIADLWGLPHMSNCSLRVTILYVSGPSFLRPCFCLSKGSVGGGSGPGKRHFWLSKAKCLRRGRRQLGGAEGISRHENCLEYARVAVAGPLEQLQQIPRHLRRVQMMKTFQFLRAFLLLRIFLVDWMTLDRVLPWGESYPLAAVNGPLLRSPEPWRKRRPPGPERRRPGHGSSTEARIVESLSSSQDRGLRGVGRACEGSGLRQAPCSALQLLHRLVLRPHPLFRAFPTRPDGRPRDVARLRLPRRRWRH